MPQSTLEAGYDEAIRFLVERINYERSLTVPYGERGFRLDRMTALLERLGNPHQHVPIVHIAGTKGKGSTAAMTAAILSAAGYRTGLYSSPHFHQLEERLVIDGKAASAAKLAEVIARVRPVVEELDALSADEKRNIGESPSAQGLTFFDVLTAVALVYFRQEQVDAAVLEVGLGGRLDSTNVCNPLVSAIVSISFDHTPQLGNTLAAIAAEKAGIIKTAVPVVSGVRPDEPRKVINDVAARLASPLVEIGRDFDFEYQPPHDLERGAATSRMNFEYRVAGREHSLDDLRLGLLGAHQAANAAVALAICAELRAQSWKISEAAIRRGLAEVHWPGRVEVISRRPAIVIDAAHNTASIEALISVLEESFSRGPRLLVFATTLEKDLEGMLRLLVPRFDEIIFTRYLNNPRAVLPERLVEAAARFGPPRFHVRSTPAEAWALAREIAGPEHLVAITGSFFIAAEMREAIEGKAVRAENERS